jgi:hypothetical protein
MTVWTFQEYCDATNSWGVRAIELKAPPPASPSAAAPAEICRGLPSVPVVVSGTSTSGSGFFDPGPDAGGPGFARRIGAAIGSGVVVSSVSFAHPTQVTLDLSTVGASPGPVDVTITNPDGQSSTGLALLTILDAAAEVDASLSLSRNGSLTSLVWSPASGATSYDVLRGNLAELPVGPGGGDSGEVCVGDDLAAATVEDAADPAQGAGFWYLVRGDGPCGAGPYGFEGSGGMPAAPRSSATCP